MNKQTNELVSYEFWDLSIRTVPLHSRLYSLAPCGLGTPLVESLTSYIAHLARAHSVTVKNLVRQEIFPLINRKYTSKPDSLSSFWKHAARSINSIGVLAQNFVQGLESLTNRTDLGSLTMLPWASVVAKSELLKPTRAWCPECFVEWQAKNRPIYEPLLWCVRANSLCLNHQRPLIEHCPFEDCGVTSPILTGSYHPGYCSKCLRWLGNAVSSENTSFTAEEWRWQIWVSKAVGQLLEHNTDLTMSPHLGNLSRCITIYLEQGRKGAIREMARKLKISKDTLASWQHGVQVPQLSTLLQFCYGCEISIYDLIALQPNQLYFSEVKTDLVPIAHNRYRPKRPRVAFDAVNLQKILEMILASREEPPPSMRATAKCLHRDLRDLRRHFPDLCRAISHKYTNYRKHRTEQNQQRMKDAVRRAVRKVHLKGEYPTHDKVKLFLDTPFSIPYGVFYAFWREALRELGLRD